MVQRPETHGHPKAVRKERPDRRRKSIARETDLISGRYTFGRRALFRGAPLPGGHTGLSTLHLRIDHDQGVVEIVVYNRAILLFTTDSEAVRRIHQVCCWLDDIAMRERRA